MDLLNTITLTQLNDFYIVVNSKSIHEAAKKLLITQPSLSVALKNLESELQLSLFDRSKRQLTLTETGKQFYQEVTSLLNHTANLEDRIKLLQKGRQFIRLGVAPMMSPFIFPVIFNHFQKAYPHIEFEVYESGVLRLKQMLKEQKLDIAFLIENESDAQLLDFTTLLKTEYHLYVGPDDPLVQLAESRPNHLLNLNDYKNIPMIFYKETSYIQAIITKYFQLYNVNPKIRLRTNQIHTIKQLVGSSVAAAFLTDKVVTPKDNLVCLLTDITFPITIVLATNKQTVRTPAIQEFIQFFENNKELI